MENMEKDILNSSPELKKMPFKVPDGYFDELQREALRCTEPKKMHVSIWTRLAPYASVAAMFLFILVLGKVFLRNDPGESEAVEESADFEDYMVFAGGETDLAIHNIASGQFAENSVEDEDIIEYLIYIGVSENDIEHSK